MKWTWGQIFFFSLFFITSTNISFAFNCEDMRGQLAQIGDTYAYNTDYNKSVVKWFELKSCDGKSMTVKVRGRFQHIEWPSIKTADWSYDFDIFIITNGDILSFKQVSEPYNRLGLGPQEIFIIGKIFEAIASQTEDPYIIGASEAFKFIAKNQTFKIGDPLGTASLEIAKAFRRAVGPHLPTVYTNIWGINVENNAFNWSGYGWVHIPGKLNQIATATDGTTWGINSDNDVFRWAGRGWEQIPGKLTQIYVGSSAHIWGINSDSDVFRWSGHGWVHIPGKLTQLSVAGDGTIWGINVDSDAFRWSGVGWIHIPGKLTQIFSGSSTNIWAINVDNDVFRWGGSGWVHIPGKLTKISTASDGTTWGINIDNDVFRWAGSGWEHIPGKLTQIYVGSSAHIWGINSDSDVFRWSGYGWEHIVGRLNKMSVK